MNTFNMKLRPLEDQDFELIEKWLHKDYIRRWYEIPQMEVTIEDWMALIVSIIYLEKKPV